MLYALALILIFSCRSNNDNKFSFYYSGDSKIEIQIIGDTLGILLKDTVLNPLDTVGAYFDDIKNLADSNLSQQGYSSAGYLEKNEYIKLVTRPKKSWSRSSLEKEAKQLKSSFTKNFVSNAGYLARIKGTNKMLILTDEIIIRFKPGTSDTVIKTLFKSYGLTVIRENLFTGIQYTVATTNKSPYDALRISQILKENTNLIFAQINFIYAKEFLSVRPNDDLFDMQWNLMNTGAIALDDADIDADLAWDHTMGSNEVVIAVIDVGFNIDHYDLSNNFSHNRFEIPGNDIDDDDNGYLNDTIGWNFNGNNGNLEGGEHGTAVIGVANAVGNNDTGIIGSCPNCNSIPIRSGHTADQDQLAIEYAQKRGANIINCSFEYGALPVPVGVVIALNNAVVAGIVVVCAMTNDFADYCTRAPDLTDIPNIIL